MKIPESNLKPRWPLAVLVAATLAAALAVSVVRAMPSAALPDTCVTSITDRWGDRGPYLVTTRTLGNPAWPAGRDVTVFSPVGVVGPRPVLFFSHGYGGNDPGYYEDFLRQMAGNGTVVVFTPYPTAATPSHMYDVLWAGHRAAVERFETTLRMDTTRIAFFGHSFGGGATPWLYSQALDEGWGRNAAALFISAPWKVLEITDRDFASFPARTKVLIQVYDDDTTNDHEYAIDDIWKKLTSIPDANKDYVMLTTAAKGDCVLPADHGVPVTGAPRGEVDGLDRWGVWRRAEALVACSADGDRIPCDLALGNGSRSQTFMGRWKADAAELPRMVWMARPVPRNCLPGEECTFDRR